MGSIHHDPESINVSALCEGIVQVTQPIADEKQVRIQINHGSVNQESVIIDRTRLSQIVLNLLHNAIKFSPHGGTIQLNVALRNHALIIEIGDQGPGIPEQERERIFKQFAHEWAALLPVSLFTSLDRSLIINQQLALKQSHAPIDAARVSSEIWSKIIVFAFLQQFWQHRRAMQKVGYIWLKEKYGIEALDYWITSYVQEKGAAKTLEQEGYVKEIYRSTAWPGDDWSSHLAFALKKEGLHLEVIKKLMPLLPKEEVMAYVSSVPTGRYHRMVWYLYESFTGERLEIEDLHRVNYVPLADPKVYLTGEVRKVFRQRVDDNLLGGVNYCALIRKKNLDYHKQNEYLTDQCVKVIGSFPDSVYQRAVSYLYSKESKSSYAIEREAPTAERARSFVNLLKQAANEDFLNKQALVELQNIIVDKRFSNDGYRDLIQEQIYVGESIAPGRERIHYIGPKPEDVPVLMELFIATSRKMLVDATLPDLVVAAVVSYLFNFIHPFSDGNGRIHRFLIHHVLAMRKFGQVGVILPISAVILNRPRDYDLSLESFSKKLVDKISYEMDERLRMTVNGETIDHYRYIDCTTLVEIFYDFAKETIETELPAEADYLLRYDSARKEMRGIVDFPDRIAELFIKCCLQNSGVISKKKQKLEEFQELTHEEINALEKIITRHFPESAL